MIGRIIIGIVALIIFLVLVAFVIKIIASIFIGLIVLAIIGVGGYWIYTRLIKKR
jgi:hypothetical protein